MTLGTRLQAARKIKGYGLRYVESMTGISISNISRVERDAFLVAHGYNLEQLDREIHELIDKLKAEASVIVARKGNENA